MLEMVGRKRAILGGERGSMLVRQLLGVEADPKPVVGGRLEQPLDFPRREGDRVAECVDAGRQAGLRRLRNKLVDDLADIMSSAILLLGRERVERQQGGD